MSSSVSSIRAKVFKNAPLPVGTDVELRLVHIFDIRDGKIAGVRVYEIWNKA